MSARIFNYSLVVDVVDATFALVFAFLLGYVFGRVQILRCLGIVEEKWKKSPWQ